jgi:hypothetical protein
MNIPSKKGRVPERPPLDKKDSPDFRLFARFLGKVGLEALAFKTELVPEWNLEIVDQPELDELRSFVRFNEGPDWPFIARSLYPMDIIFDDGAERYEVLHEFDILYTDGKEAYSVLALFGVEITINLGGRSTEGYSKWLQGNAEASPLYSGKNA